MKKWLLIGLAVILLVSLGGVVSCGTGDISGTYVNEDNPSEYLELNEDGTFYLKEMGVGFDGEWEAEGNELRLHLMGMVATAEIKGNEIYDEDGKVWVKQRGAPTQHPSDAPGPLVKWKVKLGGETNRRLLVASGIVYVPSGDEHLYALDATTGNLMWTFKTESEPRTPVVKGSIVLFGDSYYIYALDASTGILLWKFETGTGESLRVVNDVVHTRSHRGAHAVDIVTGSEKWRFEFGQEVVLSHPAWLEVSSGSVFMEQDNIFYAIDAATGKLIWKAEGIEEISPFIIAVTKDALVYGCDSPNLYALAIATGHLLWKYEAGDDLSQVIANRNTVYTSAFNVGLVYAVETATGKLKWQYSVGGQYGPWLLPPQDATLYISISHGVHAVDTTDGSLDWKIEHILDKMPAFFDLELVTGNTLYFIPALEQDIYAVEDITGKVKWVFERPDLLGQTGWEDGVVVANGITYFGNVDGWVYAVEAP